MLEWRGPGQGEGLVPSCRSALNICCPAPGWLQGDGHPATTSFKLLNLNKYTAAQYQTWSTCNQLVKFEDGMRMVLRITSLLSTNNHAFVCLNYYVDDFTIPLIVLLILFNNVQLYVQYKWYLSILKYNDS